MSSTSDQTAKPSKTRLIVGEIGVDTETGIVGKGHSYDNGKTFTVDDTIYGRIYHADDHGKIWKGIQDQVAKVVAPAKSAADSAVNAADAAVASAQVTSDAVSAVASATAEAKQGANEAMNRALSAWDVATGAKEAVTDFDPLLKQAQSDAGKALTQIADTASTLSEAKTALTSDVAEVKNLASTAQTTADSAVKSAGENAKALASQANAMSDAKKAIDSDVASAKGLANAAQATADNAVKSASSVAGDLTAVASQAKSNASGITKVTSDVGSLQTTVADTASALSEAKTEFGSGVAEAKELASTAQTTADNAVKSASSVASDLTAVASQAKANADGITKVTSDVGLLQTTVADNSGNISKIQETASQIQQAVSDNAGNITTAKQTADSAVAVASDAHSNATVAIQTASQASITAQNASGQAASAVITANGAKTTASDAKSDATVAVQTASGASLTATNAQGDATIAKQTASEAKVQASNAKSDFAQLSIRSNKIEANVADNSGNISKIQETAAQIQQAVSDNSGAIVTATQTAQSATTVASDAKSNATIAVQTASGASVTAKNAQGDATTAITTANGAITQASDAKSNATIAVQTASEASLTAANAKGDASIAKQTASDASIQIRNAQGDISKLQTQAGKIEASVATNSGAIADVQVTANQLKASVSDNSGNITVAKQTATSAATIASDARSSATVAIQTASQASITAQNASGNAASAVLTASGASLTATNAKSDATVAKQTASEAKVQASNAKSDFAQLSIRANKIEANVSDNSGAIASVQQTANGLTNTVGKVDDRVKTIEDKTNWTTKTGSLDMDTLTTTQNIFYQDTQLKNADGESGWAYIQVLSTGERVTQTVWHDRSSIQHTRTGASWGSPNYNWDAWNRAATYAQVAEVEQTANGINTIINDPKTGLNATYQTASGNASTISNVKGDVSQLQTTAKGLTSRVGSLESKTNTQQTTIDQNKSAIALKADQTDVNTLKGTVSQNTATLKTQANEISSKVTSSDVTGMLTGYATQEYTQSLVTQKADQWNLNITSLKTDVNAIKANGGGTNLLSGTAKLEFPFFGNGGTQTVQKYDDETNYIQHTSNTPINAMGPWWAWTPEVGQAYTLSADVCGNGHIIGGSFHYEGGDNGSLGQVNLTDNWQRISNTFRINTINVWQNWVIYADNSTLLKIKNIKVEKGTVAHDWSPAPSDMATVTSVTNLSATVDGIQGNVTNLKNDTSSKLTQLSNTFQSKIGDAQIAINELKDKALWKDTDSVDLNHAVSQQKLFVRGGSNLPPGGYWWYVQVEPGYGGQVFQYAVSDRDNKHFSRQCSWGQWSAWTQDVSESEITQLRDSINLRVKKGDLISQINLQAGSTLIQSNQLVLDAKTTVFTGDAFIPSAAISSISADKIMLGSSSLWNSDGTLNLVNIKDGTTSKISVTQGSVNFDGINKTASIIRFASDGNTNAFTVNPTGATVTPTLFFERFGQTPGHWLGFTRNDIQEEGVAFNTWDNDGERFAVACHARFEKNLRTLGTLSQGTWDGTTAKPEAGVLTIKSGNTIWSGSDFLAVGSNVTGTYTGVWAKAFVQQSTLSAKTNIETVDPKYALDLVNKTDIRSYQYKSDVAQGYNKRYTSLIIDDVNDVSKYYAPNEFTNEERTGRDDGSAVGYLFLAVQELTRRIKNLEEKLHE